jgi:dethiobiotin synthetase
MKYVFPPQLFVTGTNTDIGKTVVSAILVAGLNAHYWKPVQSGIDESSDTEWIREKTGLPESHFHPETYRLKPYLSPHAAAALDGVKISLDRFEMPATPETETLIVEGAGGIMVPLNEEHFILDLMKKLDIPTLLVADSELGTINHTLLSLEQIRRNGLDVLGVVMNGPRNSGNRKAIEHYGQVSVLAEIEPLPEITPQSLKDCFHRCFDT